MIQRVKVAKAGALKDGVTISIMCEVVAKDADEAERIEHSLVGMKRQEATIISTATLDSIINQSNGERAVVAQQMRADLERIRAFINQYVGADIDAEVSDK